MKVTQTRNEEAKLSLPMDGIILYIEHFKNSTKKFFRTKSVNSQDIKINIQNNHSFILLHTNNELCENKIKKIISLTIALKRINAWD
jgi:hypothetical protein